MGIARDTRAGAGSALGARLRRWLKPPRKLRPTRAGWVFCGITLAVGFAAFNTGNNLLYLVLALMLAFLVLSGVMSESALRGIRVQRQLPRELHAGRPSSVGLAISNQQRRFTAYAVVVEDRVVTPDGRQRAAGRAFALRVPAGATELRAYAFEPTQRGKLEFVEFRVYTRFPFGLFSKSLQIADAVASLAYPRVAPVAVPGHLGARRGGNAALSRQGGGGADARGLREFARGDSMRRIHWASSLRHRQLLVTETESEDRGEVAVHLRTTGIAPGEAFEERVSWAASEIVALLDADNRVSLSTDRTVIAAGSGGRHRAKLLSFLALVQPDAEPPGVAP